MEGVRASLGRIHGPRLSTLDVSVAAAVVWKEGRRAEVREGREEYMAVDARAAHAPSASPESQATWHKLRWPSQGFLESDVSRKHFRRKNRSTSRIVTCIILYPSDDGIMYLEDDDSPPQSHCEPAPSTSDPTYSLPKFQLGDLDSCGIIPENNLIWRIEWARTTPEEEEQRRRVTGHHSS